MLIEPMKTVIGPMQKQPFHGTLLPASLPAPFGSCGKQFYVFAKGILDKYTKVLNYQFDYASLVFLEQMAQGEPGERKDETMIIQMTWKLLSFLLKQEINKNQLLYQNPGFMKQIVGKLEANLMEVKKQDLKTYQEMLRCYEVYQRGGYKGENELFSYSTAREYVEQKIKMQVEDQKRSVVVKKEKMKNESFSAPFVMSRSFFINLNHWMNDNKMMNYQQIWRNSITRQLENHYLDVHMRKIVKEQDFLKKEEMLLQMFREFGSQNIQNYLEKNNETVSEHVFSVLYSFIEKSNDREAYAVNPKEPVMFEIVREHEGHNGEHVSAKKTVFERENSFEKNEETEKVVKEVVTEGYTAFSRELLLAEYKKTEQNIKEILDTCEEITRNVVIGKTEEYKELFYQYAQGILENREANKQQSAMAVPGNEVVGNNRLEKAIEVEKEQKQQEIFTDRELSILLKFAEKDKKNQRTIERIPMNGNGNVQERYNDTKPQEIKFAVEEKGDGIADVTGASLEQGFAEERKEKEQVVFLEKKLNLLATKEIVKNLAKEDAGFLQKNRLQEMLHILEKVSFVTMETKETSTEKIGTEKTSTEKISIEKTDIVKRTESVDENNQKKGHESAKRLEGNIQKYLLNRIQKQLTGMGKEKLTGVVFGNGQERKKILEVSGIRIEREKENFQEISEKMKQVFTTGSLAERKLVYLALEHNVDRLLVEYEKETKEKQARKELLQIKQKLAQSIAEEKRVLGDFRALMTKQRSSEILQTIEGLSGEIKEQFVHLVQKNVMEFCEYSMRKNVEHRTDIIYKGTEKTEVEKINQMIKKTEQEMTQEEMISVKKDVQTLKGEFVTTIQYDTIKKTPISKYGDSQEFTENVQNVQVTENLKKMERKAWEKHRLFENWEGMFATEELQYFITEEKREGLQNIAKKKILLTAGIDPVVENAKVYKQIKDMKVSDMVHLLKNGTIGEQKLMHLVLGNTISSVLEDETVNIVNMTVQEIAEKNQIMTEVNNQTIKHEHILKIKEEYEKEMVALYGTERKMNLLQRKEKDNIMIDVLEQLQLEEKKWLEKQVTEQIKGFYNILSSSREEKRPADWGAMLQGNQGIIQSNKNRQIWKQWKLLFAEGEKVDVLNSKEITKRHVMKRKNIKTEEETINDVLLKNKYEKLDVKLKKMSIYGKILEDEQVGQHTSNYDFEMGMDRIYSYFSDSMNLTKQMERKSHIHRISTHLRKDLYLSGGENTMSLQLQTQRNKEFMFPPAKENTSIRREKQELTERIKSHEESTRFILNYAKENKAKEASEENKKENAKQEKMLRQLEANLLEYCMELEDKSERLDQVEKQLKDQKQNIQSLQESQLKKQGKARPEEARKMMKQWKDEIKKEQMRRGKY